MSAGTLLASTVVAAALTAIINLSISVLNWQSTRKGEASKKRIDFETYRFKELSELLKKFDDSSLLPYFREKGIPAIRDGNAAEVSREFQEKLGVVYEQINKQVQQYEHILSSRTVQKISEINDKLGDAGKKIGDALMKKDLEKMTEAERASVHVIFNSVSMLRFEYISTIPGLVRSELRTIHDFLGA